MYTIKVITSVKYTFVYRCTTHGDRDVFMVRVENDLVFLFCVPENAVG